MDELLDLSGIFEKRIFRIPDYQRGYAWQNAQLYDFWEDLLNLQPDRDHYIGLISIKQQILNAAEKTDAEKKLNWLFQKNYQVFHIVDGQQRLTTIIILLNEIIKFVQSRNDYKPLDSIVFNDEKLSALSDRFLAKRRLDQSDSNTVAYLFDYEDPNDYSSKCLHKILGLDVSGEILSSFYTRNLENAQRFFAEKIAEFYNSRQSKISELEVLCNKISCRLKFNLHKIEDNYNVFVAFETMNNRGKKLTNLELLKNRLIYLTTLFPRSALDDVQADTLRSEINETWKEVYRQLGRNPNGLLSDDEFLRAHWIMYFQYSRSKKAAYITYLLNKFSHKSIYLSDRKEVFLEEPKLLTDNLEDQDDSDEPLKDGEKEEVTKALMPKDISDYVKSLKQVAQYWYYTFFPKDSDELSDDEKRWLIKLNRIGIAYFRPLIAVSMVSDLHFSSEDRLRLFKAVERFIFIHFRMSKNSSSFGNTEYYDCTRSVYREEKDLNSVVKELEQKTNQDEKGAVGSFLVRMAQLFLYRDGFFTWKSLKYFLFEYEDYLHSKFRRGGGLIWEEFLNPPGDTISVEHILPQKPNLPYWRNNFRQFNLDEVKQLTGSLGNLLPLAKSINSALQNDSFDDKKQRSSGYRNGCHSEVEVSEEETWDAQRIYARGMKLLKFMEDRWNFRFEDQKQMEELLHVSFVNDGRSVPCEDIKFLCEKFISLKSNEGTVHKGPSEENILRFTTDSMSKFFPETPNISSGWETASHYYYEVCIKNSEISMVLTFSGRDLPDSLFSLCKRIHQQFPFDRRFQPNFNFRSTLQTSKVKVSDNPNESEVFGILNAQFDELMQKEKQLVEYLEQEA